MALVTKDINELPDNINSMLLDVLHIEDYHRWTAIMMLMLRRYPMPISNMYVGKESGDGYAMMLPAPMPTAKFIEFYHSREIHAALNQYRPQKVRSDLKTKWEALMAFHHHEFGGDLRSTRINVMNIAHRLCHNEDMWLGVDFIDRIHQPVLRHVTLDDINGDHRMHRIADRSISIATIFGGFNRMTDDELMSVMQLMTRVMKPGGALIVRYANRNVLSDCVAILKDAIRIGLNADDDADTDTGADTYRLRLISRRDLCDYLRNYGFTCTQSYRMSGWIADQYSRTIYGQVLADECVTLDDEGGQLENIDLFTFDQG